MLRRRPEPGHGQRGDEQVDDVTDQGTDAAPGNHAEVHEPSPVVLEELIAAFGPAHWGGARPPAPAGKTSGTELPAPPMGSTAAPSPALPPTDDGSPPIDVDELIPESTRRSRRRSRREAAREARRVARRERKERKQARRRAGRESPPQPVVDGSSVAETDDDDGDVVRIIAAAPTTDRPAAAAPPLRPRRRATVAIDDDGLPDAVRSSPTDADGGRPTVFIDDRGHVTGDVVALDVATSAARMEPRLRERRIAVRRAAGRRRLKWTAIGALGIGAVVAVLAVLGSSLFAISEVQVEGAVYSRGAELDAVVEQLDGANVLRADTDEAESLLEAIPWVADARVTTDFPNGATIELRERHPVVAYQANDGRYRVLDLDGRALDVLVGRPVEYLELFVDDGPPLSPGESAPRGLANAARLVSTLTPHMRQRATAVSTDLEGSELTLELDGAIEVRFGAAVDLRDKLVRLQTALTDPDPARTPTELIDVSTEDLIVR